MGLAKSFTLDEKSLISLTAAIGSMEGTYRLMNPPGQGDPRAKGTATGYFGSAAYIYRASDFTSFSDFFSGHLTNYPFLTIGSNELGINIQTNLGIQGHPTSRSKVTA